MKLKEELLALGLTKNEVKVYTALLELGITQAGPIIKKTKLHRMLVYNALESLVEKDLASVARKKNIKLFQPGDPNALTQHTDRLNQIAKAVVPELRAIQQKKQDIVNVRTLIGEEGLHTAITRIMESAARQKKREVSILGGAPAELPYKAFGGWYDEYVDLAKRLKVKKKLLAPSSARKGFRSFVEEDNTELRVLDHGLSTPTYTRITPEMITIEMYEPQVVTILIENETMAKGYLDSFELLWKTGKAVPKKGK